MMGKKPDILIKNNDVLISIDTLVKCGVSKTYLIKRAIPGNKTGELKKWTNIKLDKIHYFFFDKLDSETKNKITQSICGGLEPHEFVKSQAITKYATVSDDDIYTLKGYIFENELKYTDKDIEKYILKLAYVNVLIRFKYPKCKEIGFGSAPEFQKTVVALCNSRALTELNIKKLLPTDLKKNLPKIINRCIKDGPAGVFDLRINNKRESKIPEEGLQLILKAKRKHNHYSNQKIADEYNKIALNKGWPTITRVAVSNINKKHDVSICVYRDGTPEWRDKFDFSISRNRPSEGGMLWVGDGVQFELYYQKTIIKNGYQETKYWNRKVVYMVIDAFNDYIVGFAIGETETADLAKQAWKNACVNAKFLPNQIKTDNFARKQLEPFYQNIARNQDYFTPSSVGNARDKVIEPFFAKFYDYGVRLAPNAAGRNIQAKEKVNKEALERIKKSFPDEDGVIKQIIQLIIYWNESKRGDKPSLKEQWAKSVEQKKSKRELTDRFRFELFGVEHEYTNRLTNKGINITINNKKYGYMDFGDVDFYIENVGKQFQVIYDPDDLSKVLIKAGAGRKQKAAIFEAIKPVPMAFDDAKKGDRENLNKMLEFKKNVVAKVTEIKEEGEKILDENLLSYFESESLLKTSFQKNALYEAQNKQKELSPPETKKTEPNKTESSSNPTKEDDPYDIYDNNELFERFYNKESNKDDGKKFNDGY